MPRYRRWLGERFGRLVVTEVHPDRYATALCDCGKTVKVKTYNLSSGNTKSCGCFLDEERIKRKLKHGMTYTRTYSIWCSILNRCHTKTATSWERYGGRGITVCDAWLKFENFFADMGECPDGLSIDRIDNALGYYKENCRWATSSEQARNKRTTRFVTYRGETKRVIEWAEIFGVPYRSLYYKLKHRNWDMEATLESINDKLVTR